MFVKLHYGRRTSFRQNTIGSNSAVRHIAGCLVGELMNLATGQRRDNPIRGRTVAIGI